jgi:hypothetical protein
LVSQSLLGNSKNKCIKRSKLPALGRLRWEDGEFEVSPGYLGRLCPKENKQNKDNGLNFY